MKSAHLSQLMWALCIEGIMDGKRSIVMLGTSADANGGIASVINVYRRHGLFERHTMRCIPTHCSGTAGQKIRLFAGAWFSYVGMLLLDKVALVHVHSAVGTSFWRKAIFLLPSFLFRVPSILHLHSGRFPQFYEGHCGAVKKWLFRQIVKRVRCTVTVSGALTTWLRGLFPAADAVTINNPMLMPDEADFARRDGSRILFLGKLGDAKGCFDLLRALAMLLDRHPRVTLVMGGDGDVDAVRAEIARLGLAAHVELPGWVSGAAKQAMLQHCAIYVLPSYSEGMPMSVLEAMAAGLVVVATRVGGIPEALTDGEEGLLVQPGDVTELAHALDWLLSHPDSRRRMGEASRHKVAAQFSGDVAIPVLESLYGRLLHERA